MFLLFCSGTLVYLLGSSIWTGKYFNQMTSASSPGFPFVGVWCYILPR